MILVTGGAGFVGGHVVTALRGADKPVRCLVRDRRKAEPLERLGVDLVEGDMTDAASLRRAVEGVATVVHLVAIRQGKPEQFERIMSEATRDLLDAARETGVGRFVLMSALGTSEQTKDLVPYYRAKWEMEQAVQGSGLPFVIFRPSFVFGRDGGILPTFCKLAKLHARHADRRLGRAAPPADLGGRRRRATSLARWTRARRRIARSSWAGLTSSAGTSSGSGSSEPSARRPSIHMPMAFMRADALVTERLPGDIPLTRDLLKMMEAGDNVVTSDDAAQTFQLPLLRSTISSAERVALGTPVPRTAYWRPRRRRSP